MPVYFYAFFNPSVAVEWDLPNGPGLNTTWRIDHVAAGNGTWCVNINFAQQRCYGGFTTYAQYENAGLEYAADTTGGSVPNSSSLAAYSTNLSNTTSNLPGADDTGGTPGINWCYRWPSSGYAGGGLHTMNFGTKPPACAAGELLSAQGGYRRRAGVARSAAFARRFRSTSAAQSFDPAVTGDDPAASYNPPNRPAPSTDEFEQFGRRFARTQASESSVTSVRIVGSTLTPTARVVDPDGVMKSDGSPGMQRWLQSPVHAIVMRGSFVWNTAPRPVDAKAPTGNTLTLLVDDRTGAVDSVQLRDSDITGLTALGSVSRR